MKRFVVVQEPTGTWAVFDALADSPVVVRDRAQIGLALVEAKVVAAMENERIDQETCRMKTIRRR